MTSHYEQSILIIIEKMFIHIECKKCAHAPVLQYCQSTLIVGYLYCWKCLNTEKNAQN